MIDQNKLNQIERCTDMFLSLHPDQLRHYESCDLVNEAVLVLLEGHRGNKIEGETMYAVYHAAERLRRLGINEMTGHDFSAEEGSVPSGRRNTEDDFVQQMEVDDWRATNLNGYQNDIVSMLLSGHSQNDIARRLGVSQTTVHRRIEEIQEIARESFDVN